MKENRLFFKKYRIKVLYKSSKLFEKSYMKENEMTRYLDIIGKVMEDLKNLLDRIRISIDDYYN